MIWDKLVDRCLLFTDAPSGLLKELLKEAEMELANKLELYDSLYTITIPSTANGAGIYTHRTTAADHNYMKLPQDYIRDVSVSHQGRKLKKVSEQEIHRKSDGTLSEGTPSAYAISSDYIIFDTNVSSGDLFVLHYKSRITELSTAKIVNVFRYDQANDHIYLDTLLGSALDGKKITFENQIKALSAGQNTSLRSAPGMMDIYRGNKPQQDPASISILEIPEIMGSRYTVAAFSGSDSLSGSAWTSMDGANAMLYNYRDIAPLIPEQFHTDLCNYAIAIANAKTSPEMYNQYWSQWMLNMDNLINEAQDRDLIFSIREEI
tara:strand:+ start:2348 stop:3307 length:960 start_codon:yes stop_codon:yes gene_type:complete